MRRILAIASFANLLLVTAPCAQRIWIVDEQNRPGADFVDLPPAVAAAAPGDTLSCRPGAYTAFTTDKGLTVLGHDSRLSGEVIVRGVPLGARFAMVGFAFAAGQEARLSLLDNRGVLVFEDVGAPQPPATLGQAVLARHCEELVMNDCYGSGMPAAVTLFRARAVLTRCQFGVSRGGMGTGSALDMEVADVEVVEPRFDAGRVAPADAAPAIVVRSGKLWVSGSARAWIQGGGIAGTPSAPAVHFAGIGFAFVGPTIPLNPFVAGPPSGGFGQLQGGWQQGTMSTPLVAGATARVDTFGLPTFFAALAIGVPGTPFPFQSYFVVLDPTQPFLYLHTPIDSSGVHTLHVPVPAAIPEGTAIAMQAFVGGMIGAPVITLTR